MAVFPILLISNFDEIKTENYIVTRTYLLSASVMHRDLET